MINNFRDCFLMLKFTLNIIMVAADGGKSPSSSTIVTLKSSSDLNWKPEKILPQSNCRLGWDICQCCEAHQTKTLTQLLLLFLNNFSSHFHFSRKKRWSDEPQRSKSHQLTTTYTSNIAVSEQQQRQQKLYLNDNLPSSVWCWMRL